MTPEDQSGEIEPDLALEPSDDDLVGGFGQFWKTGNFKIVKRIYYQKMSDVDKDLEMDSMMKNSLDIRIQNFADNLAGAKIVGSGKNQMRFEEDLQKLIKSSFEPRQKSNLKNGQPNRAWI